MRGAMARNYTTYTTSDDAVIRRMWGAFSKHEIAEELGVSVKSLEDHIRRMEPPLPKEVQRGGLKWEQFEDDALLLMAHHGIPETAIALALQRGRKGVAQRIAYLKRRMHHGNQSNGDDGQPRP